MIIKPIKIHSLLFILQIIFASFLIFSQPASAIEPYNLKIPLPGFPTAKFDGTTRPIAEFIMAIYKYAIGTVAILATLVMMIGGIVWLTAGGDSGKIGTAKQYINGALIGLVLTFCSYAILNTINPDLVNIKPVKIETIKQVIMGCCTKDGSAYADTDMGCSQKQGTFEAGKIVVKNKCITPVAGCCTNQKIITTTLGTCTYVPSEADCLNGVFVANSKCTDLDQCQDSTCTSNSIPYISPCKIDGKTGVCDINNSCKECKNSNEQCKGLLTNTPCCTGMCCDLKNTGKCISGTVKSGTIGCN